MRKASHRDENREFVTIADNAQAERRQDWYESSLRAPLRAFTLALSCCGPVDLICLLLSLSKLGARVARRTGSTLRNRERQGRRRSTTASSRT